MSGECDDCGNVLCVCRELENEPDISNCIFIDKKLLSEMQKRIDELVSVINMQCDAAKQTGRYTATLVERIEELEINSVDVDSLTESMAKVMMLTAKNVKLKQLLLLTDASVDHIIMSNLQLTQWNEFVKEFPDESVLNKDEK